MSRQVGLIGFTVPKGPGSMQVKAYSFEGEVTTEGMPEPKLFMQQLTLVDADPGISYGSTAHVVEQVRKRYGSRVAVVEDVQVQSGDVDLVVITKKAYRGG